METFGQILALAALVGLLTDRFKRAITNKQTLVVSIIIGVLLTVIYHIGT